jgi:hypothetical protein
LYKKAMLSIPLAIENKETIKIKTTDFKKFICDKAKNDLD